MARRPAAGAAKLLCILACLPFCTAAQVVEGTILNSATGTGIPAIGVNLQQVTNGPYRVYQMRTDSEGHFHFDNVQDGLYEVLYATNDYWGNEDPARIQVAAGGNPVKLESRMLPLPHITGRVVDGRGNPVPNAQVDINGWADVLGGGLMFGLETDAAGKFDVRQRPGAYTLSAVPPSGFKPPDPEKDSGQILGWARTFYPGVAVADAASRIVVRPGVDVTDIELKLLAVPVHAVRGVLLKPDGSPAPKAQMALIDTGGLSARLQAESKPDGAFEFRAVPDGERYFGFEVDSGGVKLRASKWIVMAGHDLEEVKVRLVAPFAVRGKLVVDAAQSAPPARLPQIVLTSVDSGHVVGPQMFMSARPDPDGNFTFKQVYPGTYRMDAPAPPYYLDTVRLDAAELPGPEMELTSAAPLLTVVYKTDGGTLRGSVEKCASGWVRVVPADAALRRAGSFRNARCDNNHYEVSALRPGDYYAVAFAGGSIQPPLNQDDSTLNQATRVTIRAGETVSADLRAIPQAVY